MNRRETLIALSASLIAARPALAQPAAPVVTTTNGRVRGVIKGGVSVFLGLRYGADTRPTRFQPPSKPAPWREVMAADHYGATAPQSGRPDDCPQSEDCLFLNVWTPQASSAKKRPVMFYIHGGAYNTGSGSDPLYDGTNLALRGDVVVVTVNHRLNALGYFYGARLERLANRGQAGFLHYSGNVGQMDLHLALTWVRDNIAAFGGDPNCVMVFGQSGGGAKIATMMATPAASGLFHRAATMSGQQVTASGPGNATLRARAYLKALNLNADADGLAALQTAPLAALIDALRAADPVIGSGSLYFGPVLDEAVLFRHPFWPDAPEQSRAIPMMIGNTHDETRAFLGNDPHNFDLSWDELPAKLPPAYRVDIDPYLVIETYRRLYPGITPSDLFFAATTAGRSWRGAIEEDEARARQGSPAFAYQVDFGSPRDGGKYRAQHMIDIPLVFRNTAVPGALSGDGEDARRMADLFSDAFIAFARSGSPQTPALPNWTPYSLERRETMVMNVTPSLVNDPRGEERKLFSAVPFLQQGS
jgi:para-nitrobenzyl esterase